MKTREIAEFVGGELRGDGDIEITTFASVRDAASGQIAFFEKKTELPKTDASCVFVTHDFEPPATLDPAEGVILPAIILVSNPKLAFARLAARMRPAKLTVHADHPTAIKARSANVRADHIGAFVTVGENTNIAEGCRIYDGVRIGSSVSIGKGTIVHSNCVIYENVKIGRDCTVHAGAVIGADGFGFVKDEDGNYLKFPQVGSVVIEDNVEIGANSCIDRGALGVTRVGEGTKIDNLVQVGHNVDIGKRCVIAAQTGISGSVVIEDDCVIGGQVGFGDHVRVQSGSVIGSQAGVLPGKIVRPGIWWGTPIQPLNEFKRQHAHIKGLERLKDEVKELKKSAKENSTPSKASKRTSRKS